MSAPFQVLLTDTGVAEVHSAHAKKAAQGKGADVVHALSLLEERLGTDPMAAGQHRFDLPDFGLPVMRGFVSPLILHYAVDEPRKRVYIHHVRIGA
jgi:hypothetical protein